MKIAIPLLVYAFFGDIYCVFWETENPIEIYQWYPIWGDTYDIRKLRNLAKIKQL